MKVLVTGGAGYIGSNTVYSLIEKGHEVVVLDNLSKGFEDNVHPQAKFYKGNLNDKLILSKVFKENNIDVVMDFAAFISVPESVYEPIKYFNNNLWTVQSLLEAMKEANVKNIIFSSTAAVYGNPRVIPVKESDLTDPINPYGASKLAAEMLIKSCEIPNDLKYIIFRYFNVAGTHFSMKVGIRELSVSHLIPSINNAILGITKKFSVFGTDYKETRDGSCLRDYIHVSDLAQAHILGAEYLLKNKQSHTINLGSEKGYTVLEVEKTARSILNVDFEVLKMGRRAGDPPSLLADTEKAFTILGWKPQLGLSEMIESDYKFRKIIFEKTKNE